MRSGDSIRLVQEYVRESRETTVREGDTLDDAGVRRGGSAREVASSGFVGDGKKMRTG